MEKYYTFISLPNEYGFGERDEKAKADIIKALDNNETISLGVDCIGHARADRVERLYYNWAKEKYPNLEKEYSDFGYIYKLK